MFLFSARSFKRAAEKYWLFSQFLLPSPLQNDLPGKLFCIYAFQFQHNLLKTSFSTMPSLSLLMSFVKTVIRLYYEEAAEITNVMSCKCQMVLDTSL